MFNMKKHRIKGKKFFIILFTILFALLFLGSSIKADDLDKIKQAIKYKGAKWTATETWLMKLSADEQRQMFGAVSRSHDLAKRKVLSLPTIDSLPSKFDWRKNNGNWTTPIKNEFLPIWCGTCWDYAAVGQVESWWKIHNNKPDTIIDLSEQFILSCSDAGSCDGGSGEMVLEFIREVGVPSESCFPYQASDQIPCSNACSNWHDEVVKIPGWGCITVGEPNIDNIKNAVYRSPVLANYIVYQDHMSYAGGVYEHVWGSMKWWHVVIIVGWDDADSCWICKNEFGTDWGETINSTPFTPGAGDGGWFRIKYDECEISNWTSAIWGELLSSPAFQVSPNQITIELQPGDTLLQDITLSNLGSGLLEYSSIDYQSPSVAYFRPSTFHAYSGQSWWCGNDKISGYSNNWLQYLDLPILHLSNMINPKLTFMGYWAGENPLSGPPPPPFDGWDGCNVWFSIDNGKTFEVLLPKTPAYNCSNLYSFGGVWGWNLGAGIPGWAGKSNVWVPVEFDLSPYEGDSIIIRFAFSSDGGFCTSDDPTLYGFLIDDIVVTDSGVSLFENHGSIDPTMNAHGNAGLEKADWLTLTPGSGTIEQGTSIKNVLKIDTKGLPVDSYYGLVLFVSNDSAYVADYSFSFGITIQIDLKDSTATDIQLQFASNPNDWYLSQNYPNPFNPCTKISWQSPTNCWQTLRVYDVLGNEVATLVNEEKPAGEYEIEFDASKLVSGVYFYQLKVGEFMSTKKMVLLR